MGALEDEIYAKQKELHMMKFKKEQQFLRDLEKKEKDYERRLE